MNLLCYTYEDFSYGSGTELAGSRLRASVVDGTISTLVYLQTVDIMCYVVIHLALVGPVFQDIQSGCWFARDFRMVAHEQSFRSDMRHPNGFVGELRSDSSCTWHVRLDHYA